MTPTQKTPATPKKKIDVAAFGARKAAPAKKLGL
jgi:hypothetical protein